ncbi:MAG: CBS domain-containing protein [Chloroflexi bacterium]|nr:CBS domain-containing protein [Chloroflexota bacterium]
MELRKIMVKNVITVNGEETVANAAQRMREANVGCLVVTNAGSVKGIVTDRDLTINCIGQGHESRQCHIALHMHTPVVTANPDMDVMDAIHLMFERKFRRLPVAEGDQLVGLVSFSDIAQTIERPMSELLMGIGGARRMP